MTNAAPNTKTSESIELTLHFTIEDVPGETWSSVVLRAIGPRKKWPQRKTPDTFEEAMEITPIPLPFDAICGICSPRTRSPFLCDACTVEANVNDVGAEKWLRTIRVPTEPGDFVLKGHMVWQQEDEGGPWSGAFVARSFEPRPTPTAGRYESEPFESFLEKRVLISFELPDGGQEHLWLAVTGVVKQKTADAELEGTIDDTPKYREDFKADDEVIFSRAEVEDVL